LFITLNLHALETLPFAYVSYIHFTYFTCYINRSFSIEDGSAAFKGGDTGEQTTT
jgi:hypothetical protein